MHITMSCHYCHKSFAFPHTQIHTRRYCSRPCEYAAKKKFDLHRTCHYCQNTFPIFPSEIKQGRGKYCSRKCWSLDIANTINKLWSLVQICEHGKDCPYCCWPWLGALSRGYPVWYYQRKFCHVQRLTWEDWHKKPMPAQQEGAHYCHVKICVSPSHIHPATGKENMADSIRDHRVAYGERHHKAKLVSSDIPIIFALRKQGLSKSAIARKLEVTPPLIRLILERKIWYRVPIPPELLD